MSQSVAFPEAHMWLSAIVFYRMRSNNVKAWSILLLHVDMLTRFEAACSPFRLAG